MVLHFITWAYGKDKVETVAETNAAMPFEAVLAEVWGWQHENLVRIVAFDTAIGTGSDVTKAVAEALCAKSHREEDEPYYEVSRFIRGFGLDPYEARDSYLDRADAAYEAKIAA